MRYLLVFLLLLEICINPLMVSANIANPESTLYRSVLQIFSYSYDTTSKNYERLLQGSAVYIGKNRVLTNAHVILDKEGQKPILNYELCRSIDYQRVPICFSNANLLAYDVQNDLALLSFDAPPELTPINISGPKRMEIGSSIIIYGYPQIGGDTITRTEGRIAGYVEPFYKIDGIIDHGNSGGGAFDRSGSLIGIPSKILSDNAVIGYMIPVETIYSFLNAKTSTYIRNKEKTPKEFLSFISEKIKTKKNPYIIKDTIIESKPLKPFHLKLETTYTGEKDGVATYALTHEIQKTSLIFSCMKVVGNTKLYPFWEPGDGTDYRVDYKSADNRFVGIIYEDYYGQQNYVVYDTMKNCGIQTFGGSFDFKKSKILIKDMQRFIREGYKTKTSFPSTTFAYTGSIFSVENMEENIQIYEYVTTDNAKRLSLDIVHKNKKRETLDFRVKEYDSMDGYISEISSQSDIFPRSIDDIIRVYKEVYPSDLVEKFQTANGIGFLRAIERTPENRIKNIDYRFYTKTGESYTQIRTSFSPSSEWTSEHTEKLTKFFSSSHIMGSSPWN